MTPEEIVNNLKGIGIDAHIQPTWKDDVFISREKLWVVRFGASVLDKLLSGFEHYVELNGNTIRLYTDINSASQECLDYGGEFLSSSLPTHLHTTKDIAENFLKWLLPNDNLEGLKEVGQLI